MIKKSRVSVCTSLTRGMFPRAFDLPILVGVIIATLMTFPITFTFMYLIPFAEMVDLFFGSAARMAFCAHGISWETPGCQSNAAIPWAIPRATPTN